MNYYKLEKKINAQLAALPPDSRPTCLLSGQRIQSVAYAANGCFEGRTTNGHTVTLAAEKAGEWIAK